MNPEALFIIDMQNDFILENAPLKVNGALEIVPNIIKLLKVCRELKIPVFHIVREHRRDGSDVEIIRKEIFLIHPFAVSGTPGASIIKDIIPLPEEYIIKKVRMSAFIATDLDLILKTLKINTIYVTGIQTPNCIRATVYDAIAFNYNVTLVSDAVKAQSAEIHASNVRDMQNIGVKVTETSSLYDSLIFRLKK